MPLPKAPTKPATRLQPTVDLDEVGPVGVDSEGAAIGLRCKACGDR